MRPVERIPKLLTLLEKYWRMYPDLRLGQIISNFTPHGCDPFYNEDDELIAILQKEVGAIIPQNCKVRITGSAVGLHDIGIVKGVDMDENKVYVDVGEYGAWVSLDEIEVLG